MTTDPTACTCGTANPTSARYQRAHLSWCAWCESQPMTTDPTARIVATAEGVAFRLDQLVTARLANDVIAVLRDARTSILALADLLLRRERDEALSSPMAAGLLLTLKAECEAQHARAEAAEQRVIALEVALEATGKQPNPCPQCGAYLWDDPRPCWNCARVRALTGGSIRTGLGI